MKLIPVLLTSIVALFVFLSAFANPSVFYGAKAERKTNRANLIYYGRIHAAACGGILIYPEWALFSAHCINLLKLGEPLKIEVRVGEYDTSIPDGERSIQVTEVYTFGYQWSTPYLAVERLLICTIPAI